MALTQLINGNFQDAAGNLLANGTLVMELAQDANLSGGQGQVSGGKKITVQLDADGNVLGSSTSPGGPAQYVWPTDEMSPSGVTYTVWAYSADGQLAWGPNYGLQVPSSPNPFDIDNWSPNIVIAPLASLGGLTLQTNGVDNTDQNTLNLIAGTNVTLTAGVSGDVTIAASGGGGSTPIVFAENFSGANWGLKVAAAFASFSGQPGEVWVSQGAGTSALSQDLSIPANSVLRFFQGGTFDLGAHRIVVAGGVNHTSLIGSSSWGGVIFTYSGSDYAIVVGDSATRTFYTLIQDVTVTASSTALGGYHVIQHEHLHMVRPQFTGAGSGVSQIPIFLDGHGTAVGGNFSAYAIIEHPACENYGTGIGLKIDGASQSDNNANVIIGGEFDSGSTGTGCYINGDSNCLLGVNFEDVGIALDIAGHFNLCNNVRSEGVGTYYVQFESGAGNNVVYEITDASFVTVNDLNSSAANNSVIGTGTFLQQIDSNQQTTYIFGPSADEPLNVVIRPGVLAEQQGNLTFQSKNGSTQFTLQKDSSNDFFIDQQGKSAPCFVIGASGAVGLNSNSGQLLFNSNTGASSSGVGFYSGGSTSVIVGSIDGGGNIATNPATLATTSNHNSPSIKLSGNWSPQQATVTHIDITSNVLTVTCANSFAPGLQATIIGLSTFTFLNNVRLNIATASGSQFTAAFTHANTSGNDSGTAYESEADVWSLQTVVGTGATPTSTLTVTHSGSTGAAELDLEGVATAGSAGSASLYLPILVNGQPYKIALLAP